MKIAKTMMSLFATASVVAMAAPAFAQADDTTTDVVVTAQKRSERVQDVPLSINVVTAAELARSQINTVADLARIAPSLEVGTASGRDAGGGGYIRGLGTATFNAGAVGAVGIVVDGVSQGNTNISDLFDVERVEVLKGPQGTLFGLTTSAGVINITTRAPGKELGFRAKAEVSGEGVAGSTGVGKQVYQASANLPLGDIAGLRVSAFSTSRQGPNRNALDGSLNEFETLGGRARLNFTPTDNLTVDFNADYTDSKNDGPDFFTIYKTDAALTAQLANCRLSPASPVTPVEVGQGNRDYCTTRDQTGGQKNYGGSASVTYDFGPISATAISSARQTYGRAGTTVDIYRLDNALFAPRITLQPPAPPLTIFTSPTFLGAPPSLYPSTTSLVTHEFRIASPGTSKIEYTAGLFYSDQSTHNKVGNPGFTPISCSTFGFCGDPGSPAPFVTPGAASTGGSNAQLSKAVFGQATFHLTEQFSLIAGARYNEDVLKQTTYASGAPVNGAPATVPRGTPAVTRAEFSATSWRAGARYEFDDTLNAYASVARGYKGGQFAAPACGNACPAGTPSLVLLPEVPTNYEVGAKKTMFDGRLIGDLSVFYIDMKNYQGDVCTVNPTTSVLGCTSRNFDGVKSKGIEANVFGRVNENLTVNTGIIWNPATYPERAAGGGIYLGQDGSNIGGKQLANVPEWKYTLSTEYSHAVGNGLEGFVSGDGVYRSVIRYAPSSDPNLNYPANWIIGGRAGVRGEDGKWSASLFVRNLTDEHVPALRQGGFINANTYGQFLTEASFRTVGLALETNF